MNPEIQCGRCQKISPLDHWKTAQPENHFQCPNCSYRFRRESDPPTIKPNGFLMPGRVRLVELEPNKSNHPNTTPKLGRELKDKIARRILDDPGGRDASI